MASLKDLSDIFLTKNTEKSNTDKNPSTFNEIFWINQLCHDLEQANKFDREHKVRDASRPWIQCENPEQVSNSSRLRYFLAIVLIILAISLPIIIVVFIRSSTSCINENVGKKIAQN